MTALGRVTAALPEASRLACAHCGAPVEPGAAFCCTGCEGAAALIAGLGLNAFYRRRDTASATGGLRPVAAPPGDVTPLVRGNADGTEHTLELLLSGLTCGACIWLVEQTLAAEPDVMHARASLTARRLTIIWRGGPGRANALVALLARLGFHAAPWSPACLSASDDAEGRALIRALGVAAFGSMNVMLASVAVWAGGDMGEQTRALLHWLAALVALPVVAYAGLPFYRSALAALRAGRVNMDVAVSVGVLATTAMSLSEALRNGRYTWFDGATALLALLLAGRVIERAARRRAGQAVAELLALQSGTVTRLAADGTASAVTVAAVEPGDRLLIAAGERLRLDGIAETATLLDTAATTGEAVPRECIAGRPLPAGAINMGAAFVLCVTLADRDGSVATMARLLERGALARGRFVSLADRGARFYVPVAHGIALATFLGWWRYAGLPWQEALVPAVAALIITCPCGLAIAVPAVQAVAVGALFRRGVLVTSPTALERLASADHVVLDKTGTLTEGRLLLRAEDAVGRSAALRQAAGMARASRHPLAHALVDACPEAPALAGVIEYPGLGLERGLARLGSARFCGVPRGATDGTMLWYRAAPNAEPVGFRFADRMRPEAAAAVAALRRLGLSVELLSGDAEASVAAAAGSAGIESWQAGATPAGKAARIADLAASGRRVLMVGDGLNDAGALAVAHVSASPAGATDLAQSAADLVLQDHAGLAALPDAIILSRRSQHLARQNIGFSLAYNAVAVPCAVAGLATPLIAALVMA
ncbi:MAG: fixI, partial [Belnapia sp.]|nr:fixI [Belnapia sp.]